MRFALTDFSRPTAHPRARYFRRLALAVLAAYLFALIYFSLVPTVPSAEAVGDKILHFLAYGGLVALAAAAWPRLRLLVLFLGASFMGAILEIGQGLLEIGRTASFADQLANMIGAGLAVIIWIAIKLGYTKARAQLKRG